MDLWWPVNLDDKWFCSKCGRECAWEWMPLAEFLLEEREEFVWALACSHSGERGEQLIANCTSCNKEFPAEDLCPKGRCVDCYDRSVGGYRSPEYRKQAKARWNAANPDRVKEIRRDSYERNKTKQQ